MMISLMSSTLFPFRWSAPAVLSAVVAYYTIRSYERNVIYD